MSSLLNGLGDAAGTVMNVTSDVALTAFLVLLGSLVVGAPLYMLYAVLSSLRPGGQRPAARK